MERFYCQRKLVQELVSRKRVIHFEKIKDTYMLKFHRSVASNSPIQKLTGAVFQLKTRPTSDYVDLSQLIECPPLHAPNHQVMRCFRYDTTQICELIFIRILVVGSTKWIQKKNLEKPTVEAFKMSYNEDINERAQVKLNTGR